MGASVFTIKIENENVSTFSYDKLLHLTTIIFVL